MATSQVASFALVLFICRRGVRAEFGARGDAALGSPGLVLPVASAALVAPVVHMSVRDGAALEF